MARKPASKTLLKGFLLKTPFASFCWLGLTLGLGGMATSLAHAGAWPLNPGAGHGIGNLSYLQADQVVDSKGKRHNYNISEIALNGSVEIGIAPQFSAGAAICPQKIVISDSGDAIGASDLELWADQHLWTRGKLHFAMRLLAVFPVGLENPGWTPDWLYALHSQGGLAAELMPLLGWSYHSLWMQGGLGARLRGNGLAGQFKYQYALGKSFGADQWLALRLGFSGLIPLDTQSNGKPSDQEQYYGQQLAAETKLPQRFRLGLQFDSMVTPGQELPLGLRSNLYLAWSWI
jgi:hypothetical protein